MILQITLSLDDQKKLSMPFNSSCTELNPKELLLYATAQCTGLTILSQLKKERCEVSACEITVAGNLSTPVVRSESVYESFNIHYNLHCPSIEDQSKISDITLMVHERLCGMVEMLRMIAPVSHQIDIVSTESVEV